MSYLNCVVSHIVFGSILIAYRVKEILIPTYLSIHQNASIVLLFFIIKVLNIWIELKDRENVVAKRHFEQRGEGWEQEEPHRHGQELH